jgi:hypothetical protein
MKEVRKYLNLNSVLGIRNYGASALISKLSFCIVPQFNMRSNICNLHGFPARAFFIRENRSNPIIAAKLSYTFIREPIAKP